MQTRSSEKAEQRLTPLSKESVGVHAYPLRSSSSPSISYQATFQVLCCVLLLPTRSVVIHGRAATPLDPSCFEGHRTCPQDLQLPHAHKSQHIPRYDASDSPWLNAVRRQNSYQSTVAMSNGTIVAQPYTMHHIWDMHGS